MVEEEESKQNKKQNTGVHTYFILPDSLPIIVSSTSTSIYGMCGIWFASHVFSFAIEVCHLNLHFVSSIVLFLFLFFYRSYWFSKHSK